jgi:hypothetical protein
MASPAELYDQLDLRAVVSSGVRWHVEVYAIQEQGDYYWIQVGLLADELPSRSLVIRTSATVRADVVLATIEEWLSSAESEQSATIKLE